MVIQGVTHTHLFLRNTVGSNNVRRTGHVDAALIVLEVVIAEAVAWDQAVEEAVCVVLGFLLASNLVLAVLVGGCRGLSRSCPWHCLTGVVGIWRGKVVRSGIVGGTRCCWAATHAAEALEGKWLGAAGLEVEGLHSGVGVRQGGQVRAWLFGAVLALLGRGQRGGKSIHKALYGPPSSGSGRGCGGRE
jgi:hypothetical protein